MSLLCSALSVTCPYCLELYMQRVRRPDIRARLPVYVLRCAGSPQRDPSYSGLPRDEIGRMIISSHDEMILCSAYVHRSDLEYIHGKSR